MKQVSTLFHFLIGKTISLFILLALYSLSHSVYAKYDPTLDWLTLETDYFIFHYEKNLTSLAAEFVNQADAIHKEVSEFSQWSPKAKTHVILSDQSDLANGNATPLPRNRIEIYMSAPAEIASLEDYSDWKNLVFKHEYVHITHLDKAHDFPLDMRSILGRYWLFFPNTFLPAWITEGIATYIETDNEIGIGRGQSSYFRALMRNEVTRGIRDLKHVNNPQLDWPSGATRYLYGVYFFKFLEEKYGKESIQNFIDAYSRFPIPYFISTVFKTVYGKSLHTLWIEFDAYLHNEFDEEIINYSESDNKITSLSRSGYFSGFSKIHDGNILYIKNDRTNVKSLQSLNPNTGEDQVILTLKGQEGVFGQTFDVHNTSGILMPKLDLIGNTELIFDLYVINSKNKTESKITSNQRFIKAVWTKDGENIIALKNEKSKHSLIRLEKNGKYIEDLWTGNTSTVISAIDYSPTEDKLIASIFRPGLGWNIELFDINTLSWKAVTRNKSIESHPQFLPDGKSIIYVADYFRVYNIFELNLENKQLKKLTQTNSAILFPQFDAAQNKLYFAHLDLNGFELASQDYESNTSIIKANIFNEKFVETPSSTFQLATENTPTAYNGLKYLRPTFWQPFFFIDSNQTSIGLITTASDPLFWHNYILVGAYDFKNSSPIWDLTYVYQRFKPNLILSYSHNNFYSNKINNTTEIKKETDYSLIVELPFIKVKNQWKIFTAARRLETEKWDKLSTGNKRTASINEHLGYLGLSYKSTLNTSFAATQHSGIFASFAMEHENFTEINPHKGRLINEFAMYSPPILKSVFELDLTVILSGGETEMLTLGGSDEEFISSPNYMKRNYSLKGYSVKFAQTNLQKLDLAAHIPIAFPQASIMAPPLGIDKMILKLFTQTARVGSFHHINDNDWFNSIGAEIKISANFGYGRFPFSIIGGYARGLNRFGENSFYAATRLTF